MDMQDHASFTVRHDGWTPERQARFLDRLAARGNVRLACRHVGMSPEAAYRLRRRDELFARGWAAALLKAREVAEQVLAEWAIDGVEEAIWYRGEHMGSRRRFDGRLFLAHMARLDKLADEEGASADAARFDELLACIAGEAAPGDLESYADVLPFGREQAGEEAARQAEFDARHGELEADFEELAGINDPEALCALEDKCLAIAEEGRARGEEQWDAWFETMCGVVDRVCRWADGPAAPGLPGNPLPAPLKAAIEAAVKAPPLSVPSTLSTTSTSALARALAGPVTHSAPTPGSPFAAARK